MICKITFVEGRGRSDIGTGSGVCFILFSARQHPNDDHTPNLGSHMVSALFWLKWQSPRPCDRNTLHVDLGMGI